MATTLSSSFKLYITLGGYTVSARSARDEYKAKGPRLRPLFQAKTSELSRLARGFAGRRSSLVVPCIAISQYSKNGICYYRGWLAAIWWRSSCFALGLRKNAALFVPIQLQPVVKPHGHKLRLTAAPVEHGGRAVMEAL